MMVAILLYAYCLGLRSSRRIARALEEDVGFRVVAANRQPDFRTICRIRAEQEEALEEQIIVAVGVTQEANDVQQLEPMLQTMAHTLEAAGIEDRPKAGLADAGYWSEANIRACSWPEMPELLIATTKDWKQRKMLREKGCPRGRIPKGLSPWDRMERKLLTKRGRALYKKRGVLVEPVFGQVKEGQEFRRFMRRGLGAAQSEWSLAGMTHNLLKLWCLGQGTMELREAHDLSGGRQAAGGTGRADLSFAPSLPHLC